MYKVVDGKAVATQITVESLSDGKSYIIKTGVQTGDTIVAEGVGLLQDGVEISIKQN